MIVSEAAADGKPCERRAAVRTSKGNKERSSSRLNTMAERSTCPICGKRRPERFCPAKCEKICAICCGTEREVALDCPSDCSFLIAAHRYEIEHWKDGKISWDRFAAEYRKSLTGKEDLLTNLAEESRAGTITLLCTDKDPSRCHRSLLKSAIEERLM